MQRHTARERERDKDAEKIRETGKIGGGERGRGRERDGVREGEG